MSEWGYEISERRQRLKLSQSELAKLCDCSQAIISQIEAGNRKPSPSLKATIELALSSEKPIDRSISKRLLLTKAIENLELNEVDEMLVFVDFIKYRRRLK